MPEWTWATAMFRASINDARIARRILERGYDGLYYEIPLTSERRAYLESVIKEGREAEEQLRDMGLLK